MAERELEQISDRQLAYTKQHPGMMVGMIVITALAIVGFITVINYIIS